MQKTNALKSVAIVLVLVVVVGVFSVFLPSNDNPNVNKDTSNESDIPETEACAHLSFGEWTYSSNYHIRKCSSCTFFESEPHNYVESVCSVCGVEEPQEEVEEHECQFDYLVQMNLVKSTCQVKGSCVYPCNVEGCKETQTVALELAPHNYIGDWIKYDDLQHKKKCEWCTDYKYESHKWDNGFVSKAPTETETGEKTYACGVCGGSRVETLAALGSTTDTAVPDVTVCTHDNATFEYKNIIYHFLTCPNCDVSNKQEQHYSLVRGSVGYNTPLSGDASKHLRTCLCGFELEVDHTYENGACVYCGVCEWHRYTIITSKYDETSGEHINQYVCEKCGYAKTYSCNPAFTDAVASTCTTQGYSEAECDDCRGTIVILKALAAHDYDSGKITTSATCVSSGIKTFTCVNCGNTKTETLYSSGHSYYTVSESCISINDTQHQFVIGEECAYCGESITNTSDIREHYFVNDVCSDCNYERSCSHENTEQRVTDKCNYVDSDYHEFIYEDYCTKCGTVIYEFAENFSHTFDDNVCSECGYTRTSSSGSSSTGDSSDYDGECSHSDRYINGDSNGCWNCSYYYCPDCSEQFEYQEYYSHSFTSAGTCSSCGTSCSHEILAGVCSICGWCDPLYETPTE